MLSATVNMHSFLGFLADSVKQAYILPEDKKDKLIVLRESILSQKEQVKDSATV